MKEILLRLACRLLNWSGLPWLIREVYARHKVTIVNYHNPQPDVFEQHVCFYAHHYSFVSIDQVVDAIEKQDFSNLPPKPLLITFDDGYADNALLFPILQLYRIPAVIYAVAGVVGTNRRFWFDLLPHYSNAMNLLKTASDEERRNILKRDYDHWDEKEYDAPVALSQAQLSKFIRSTGTVGSHTKFHPFLDKCEEDAGLQECVASRESLEAMTGLPVLHFALPNGNGDERVMDWVRRAGYRSCRTTSPGWVTKRTDPFSIPNYGVADNATVASLPLRVTGIYCFLRKLAKASNEANG